LKLLLAIIIVLSSQYVYAGDIKERKVHIKEMEAKVSKLSEERKIRSESILKEFNVPINKYLPYIEDESEALVRAKDEIAIRALSLLVVAVKAEGLEQDIVESIVDKYSLQKDFTPKEIAFIKDSSPSQHDKTQFIWRYEAAWTLLWALGYVEELSPPTHICDVPAAVTFMQQRTREEFLSDSKLRTLSDILNETDLIYRYHWAVVDARVNGLSIPSNIDSSVVMERHYALNWLIGYMDQEWDDVSTDT
jgi:Domain of unknown function (DUF4272)